MSTEAAPPAVVDLSDLAVELGGAAVEFEGRDYGSSVSVIIVSTDKDGDGPALHQHPYDETFVVRGGQALFTVGDQELVGRAGQIIVVPPLTPHKFAKIGDERLEMTDVHASEVFITEWLE